MKKLTKLTALALALALVLGMTALAGTPSEIILSDNFNDATDLTWDTFGATRTKLAASVDAYSGSWTPTEGKYKYFFNKGANLVNVNGKVVIQDATANHSGMSLVYAVPTNGWKLADNNDGAYALVAQMEWAPLSWKANQTNYGHVGFSGLVYSSVSQDGATTKNNVVRGTLGVRTTTVDEPISFYSGNMSEHNAKNMSVPLTPGETTVIRHVVRNAIKSYNENEVITDADAKSLNMLTYVGRNIIGGQSDFRTNPNGDAFITSVDGFFFTSNDAVQHSWNEFVMYKLSLDRADFLYERDSMTTTNIELDGDFEIIFNQPISVSRINSRTDAILPGLTVTTGAGDDMVTLVRDEDYAIEVSEKVVGTAIKGVLKIKPLKDWDCGVEYTVTLPDDVVVSAARISILPENNAPVVFKTIAPPTFEMKLEAYKGLSATGTALESLSAGTTYFTVSAVQKDGAALTNGNIRLEILDAQGNVVKYATYEKELGATGTSFGAAFKLAAGQTAKAYVAGTEGVATID